jgi:hypothetical protein
MEMYKYLTIFIKLSFVQGHFYILFKQLNYQISWETTPISLQVASLTVFSFFVKIYFLNKFDIIDKNIALVFAHVGCLVTS